MVNALDRSEKAQFHLVTFTYGSPIKVKRYTNWDSDIDPTGRTFISLPEMEISLASNEATFQETPTKLKMFINEVTTALLDPLTRGTPFAPVKVEIQEIIDPARIGDAGSSQIVMSGRIYRTRRNADGRSGLCVIEVRNQKSLLDVSLGFQVNTNCVWRLNGVGCTEATHSPSGYFSKIAPVTFDGKILTANDTALVLDLTGTRSWSRGFVELDNIKIGIFFYDLATFNGQINKDFQLVRQPPEEWQNQTITFFPGCTKQIDGDGGCRVAWDNEEGFGGSGIAIPAHNPIMENTAGS